MSTLDFTTADVRYTHTNTCAHHFDVSTATTPKRFNDLLTFILIMNKRQFSFEKKKTGMLTYKKDQNEKKANTKFYR